MECDLVGILDKKAFLKEQKMPVFNPNDPEAQFELTQDEWALVDQLVTELGEWEGNYQGIQANWLRWTTQEGQFLKIWNEKSAQSLQELPSRAAQEHQKAERLAAQLRALGVEPEVD
jgi:hypothetical protein